jgi:hypothetical protein
MEFLGQKTFAIRQIPRLPLTVLQSATEKLLKLLRYHSALFPGCPADPLTQTPASASNTPCHLEVFYPCKWNRHIVWVSSEDDGSEGFEEGEGDGQWEWKSAKSLKRVRVMASGDEKSGD